ncbi:MAG: peptide chain release factor 1 [Candidatus Yanofskybacteria bacterium]|nr:peptide chain release factor 1 [Candidatus Yanofskybacteria bacterium]
MQDLNKIREEYNQLTEELMNPELISDWEKFQEVSKKRAAFEKIVKKAEELENIRARIEENKQILSSYEEPELSSLAEQELTSLKDAETKLEKELDVLLSGDSPASPSALIMEIRAGTGGDEAALFAAELLLMYRRFAEKNRWKLVLLSSHESELGGLKEAIFEVAGDGAFAKLRHEGGVHRVQRIPETEKQGRIHTSTVSVAVLPKPKKEEFHINPADIKIETTTSSGPGGQNVNKRQTAARLIHIPSGIMIVSDVERNLQGNKEHAMAILQARLLAQEQQKQQQEISGQRKAQIGTAERSEKIRTYNFPQDRITDHRVKESWHGIERIMKEGDLDEIAETLQEQL